MKDEIYMKISAKETFCKKFPLNTQKQGSGSAPLPFCNTVAKLIKVLREFEEAFRKDLSQLKIFNLA